MLVTWVQNIKDLAPLSGTNHTAKAIFGASSFLGSGKPQQILEQAWSKTVVVASCFQMYHRAMPEQYNMTFDVDIVIKIERR